MYTYMHCKGYQGQACTRSTPPRARTRRRHTRRSSDKHLFSVTNTFSHWTIVCHLDETQRQRVLSVHLCHVSSCRAGRPGAPRAAS
eukprot:COSAG02_NODE_5720_length_4097_cov_87.890445_1_plen_85_part_10